jgi:F-type H+-transporting ATPase subunit c
MQAATDPLALVLMVANLAAAIALLNGALTSLGQGKVAASAVEAIARQPEAAGDIRTTMIVGLAMSETAGIYGLLIAFVMLFANPLVNIAVEQFGR